MTGRPILTANAMRAAEAAAIDAGTPIETLMERAGAALAQAVFDITAVAEVASPERRAAISRT